MFHRVLTRYPRTVLKRTIQQTYNYLLVLDFEATCLQNELLIPQEIIEFPCVILSTENWKVKDVFHQYVKPKIHPTITPFCTELTGIMQETVDDQPHFPEVLSQFCTWLENNNCSDKDESAIVTCGNWDLKTMLPNQCKIDNIQIPEIFTQWIDLKEIFCNTANYFPRSLKNMLFHLNLPMEGRLHSGIHDTYNMVRIIQDLSSKHNAEFKITSSLYSSKFKAIKNSTN